MIYSPARGSSYYLGLIVVAMLLVMSFSGCETVQPKSPRETLAVTYTSIQTAADGIATLKRNGTIDDERKNKLLDDLQVVLDNTKLAEQSLSLYEQSVSNGSADETEQQRYLRYVGTATQVLVVIQRALMEASK